MSLDGERGVSLVSDHPFAPRGDWWSLCRTCGLGQAAHQIAVCPDCGGSGVRADHDGFGNYDPCPTCQL